MLLKELNEKFNDLKDVNVVDDLQFYMNNDPAFYRKILYPAILSMKEKIKGGSGCKEDHFLPCIKKGMDAYCQKFKIKTPSKDIFSSEEIQELAQKMFHQEKTNIEKGVYDRRDQ